MHRFLKYLWCFGVLVGEVHGQKPEYLFYSWDANKLPQTIPVGCRENEPMLLAETRIVEFAVDAVYILQHRKVYYPSWAATTKHRGEPVQGKLLMMQARLLDASGGMLETNTGRLLAADTQENFGVMMFGGRKPACVLEYLTVVKEAPLKYLNIQYLLAPAQATRLLLVHPPELTVAYSFTGLDAVSERYNRDEKVFTEVQLKQVLLDSQMRSTILPTARLVVKRTNTGYVQDWPQVAVQLRKQFLEASLAPREEKQIRAVYRRLKQGHPAPLKKQIMSIPELFRREKLSFSHKAMHHLLLLLDVPHEFVLATDRTRAPLDTSLAFLPDISETFLWIPAIKTAITTGGRFTETLPLEYAGCMALFIPMEAYSIPVWKEFPLPEAGINKNQAVVIYTGNAMLQFKQQFEGNEAALWKDYGRLNGEQRGEADVAVCRSLIPESWLLDARAQQLPDKAFSFEGVCSFPDVFSADDSVFSLEAAQLLLPQMPLEAFPGTLWERSLRIPVAYLEDAATWSNDAAQVCRDAVSTVSYIQKKDDEWLELTVRINIHGCCTRRYIETGSLRLPASITLRKKSS